MLRVAGTRRWIARIMISWGLIAACMMFVGSPRSFYAMRFLLAWVKPGSFPGCCST